MRHTYTKALKKRAADARRNIRYKTRNNANREREKALALQMLTGKIRNQQLEKRSAGEQGGYIGVWAMCSFILALPGSVAGQFAAGGAAAGANTGLAAGFITGLVASGTYAAVTYQSRKITPNLLGGQKVLIINDPDLGAITTHAQEVIKELPASYKQTWHEK